MIINSTDERTFSKLKLLKSCHRSSMAQDCLNLLTIMTVENDILQSINFQKILPQNNLKNLISENNLIVFWLCIFM